LGIGDWGLGIGPNPQSPIPNPQSPIPIKFFNSFLLEKIKYQLLNLHNYIYYIFNNKKILHNSIYYLLILPLFSLSLNFQKIIDIIIHMHDDILYKFYTKKERINC